MSVRVKWVQCTKPGGTAGNGLFRSCPSITHGTGVFFVFLAYLSALRGAYHNEQGNSL